jgi:hypothetical protein
VILEFALLGSACAHPSASVSFRAGEGSGVRVASIANADCISARDGAGASDAPAAVAFEPGVAGIRGCQDAAENFAVAERTVVHLIRRGLRAGEADVSDSKNHGARVVDAGRVSRLGVERLCVVGIHCSESVRTCVETRTRIRDRAAGEIGTS